MERLRNQIVDAVCDEGYLELGEDTVTLMTVAIFLQRIVINTITYEKYFTLRQQVLLSERQVKYVEDIVVTRYMEEPWDVEEGGDKGHIRYRTGK